MYHQSPSGTASIDPHVMPLLPSLTMPPPALPLPFVLSSLIHRDSCSMLDFVASYVSPHLCRVTMVRRMSAVGEMHERFFPSAITRTITDVADNESSAVVAGLLQYMSSAKDGEYAPRRVTVCPAPLFCPSTSSPTVFRCSLHLLDARAANALVAGDSSADFRHPSMDGGVLVTVRVTTTSTIVKMLYIQM